MSKSPSSVGKEHLTQLNFPMQDSSFFPAEEDLIAFSPTPTAPHGITVKQETNKASFVKGPADPIDKFHAQALFRASRNYDPFVNDSDEDDDHENYNHSLYIPAGQHPPINTTPFTLTPRLSQQTSNETNNSDASPATNSLQSLMASPTPVCEAPYPPINSPGCVVTIHNLPYDISMRDVLARISGGEVRTATLLKLRNAMCAVITFRQARSAQQFVHASRSFDNKIWTFQGTGEDTYYTKALIAYVPTLDTSKLFNDPFDIPMEPRHTMEFDLATRCLAIKNCSFELIEEIWTDLSLSYRLSSSHYTNQFEDIWLDNFQRGRDGRIESTTMHIWYTSIDMALGAKHSVANTHWSKNMRFEADPCDDTPAALFFRPTDDAGFAWHSNPNHSLLNVHKAGSISELFRTWRKITQVLKEAREAVLKPREAPKVLPSEDMAARRRYALRNGGFDPVTLMFMSSQDYDSDDEGRRGPPRIDTRKIEAQRIAKQTKSLKSRTAYLIALIDLAANAPSMWEHSPGTSTMIPTVHEGPGDESDAQSVMEFLEHDEDACDEPVCSPAMQSNEANDSKHPVRSDPIKNPAYSEENLTTLKRAFKQPTHWYTVSLAEFLACNEQQRKAMGTVFYIPPEGHDSLKKYPWTEVEPLRSD